MNVKTQKEKKKYLVIADECEGADEEFEDEKLLVNGFFSDGEDNGERFRSEELRQAGTGFDQRFHVLGDQKRFEESKRFVAETTRSNGIAMLAIERERERDKNEGRGPSALD